MKLLPIKTTIGDRIFIGAVLFIGIHLLWMRFVEGLIPLWGGTIVSLLVAFVIIFCG